MPSGRPTFCTPELIKRVEKIVGGTGNLALAAEFTGINPGLFYLWRKQGKNNDGPAIFATFAEAVDRAYVRWEDHCSRLRHGD